MARAPANPVGGVSHHVLMTSSPIPNQNNNYWSIRGQCLWLPRGIPFFLFACTRITMLVVVAKSYRRDIFCSRQRLYDRFFISHGGSLIVMAVGRRDSYLADSR